MVNLWVVESALRGLSQLCAHHIFLAASLFRACRERFQSSRVESIATCSPMAIPRRHTLARAASHHGTRQLLGDHLEEGDQGAARLAQRGNSRGRGKRSGLGIRPTGVDRLLYAPFLLQSTTGGGILPSGHHKPSLASCISMSFHNRDPANPFDGSRPYRRRRSSDPDQVV